MPPSPMRRSGGQILVDQLRIHGANLVFGVPGESYLPVLDALHDAADDIRFIVCRQEGGAAYMADAYGKLTGRPGICFVSRGPGAANASIGIHTARQDSTPLIAFVGQVPRHDLDREAFQEVDHKQMFGALAKWVAQIDDPGRIPEYVARAFAVATSGRPGPVVLVVPEDVLSEQVIVADAVRHEAVEPFPDPAALARLSELLAGARAPIVLLGGTGWTDRAAADLGVFAEANGLPVVTAFRRQDRFDATHACYAGDLGLGANPALSERIRQSDLILAIGTRLGDVTTASYRLLDVPVPRQTLVHVHPSADELGRLYRPALGIVSGIPQIASALRRLRPVDHKPWHHLTDTMRAAYLAYTTPTAVPGPVQLSDILASLRDELPVDTIIAHGAGNYTGWIHRYWRYRRLGTQLAPISGAMGYGVPAAVAAALLHPDRTVLSFSGDGCFLMNGQELATAMQYRVAPIFFVVDNGMYGSIRMHQEMTYPGRTSGTDLVNPDFAALALAYGAHGETVTRTDDFAAAFRRARSAGRAAVIVLRVDPNAITTGRTLTGIRNAALAKANGLPPSAT